MGASQELDDRTHAPSGAIVIFDAAGVVQAMSSAAEQLLGQRASDLLGKTLDLVGRSDAGGAMAIAAEDGATRSISVQAKLVSVSGEPFIVALLDEPTAETPASGHEPSVDELRVAVATAAPDLKSFTATSRLVSRLLRGAWTELDPEDRSELAARLDRDSALHDRLVDWLLDIARLQRGDFRPRPRRLALSLYLLTRIADHQQHLPRVRLSCPRELTAVADPDQLWPILRALIIQASDLSGVPVRVSAALEGDVIVVRVFDEVRRHAATEVLDIFDAHLAAARALAKANGGALWYDHPDEGTPSFCLSLRP